jgi:trigger factor
VQVKVEKTKACQAHVSFTVPAEEFAQELRKLVAEAGRHARMKGFRPGHIPPAVIERLHGQELRREARQRFAQRAWEQAIGEHELRPFTQPRIDVGEGDPEGGAFSLEFDVTLRPDIELAPYKELEIESAIVPVSAEEVQAAVEQIQRNQARPEPAGEAGLPADGMAVCKLELVFQGEVVFTRDGLRLGPQMAVPGVAPQAFEQALTGLKDGEQAEVPLVFPPDFEVEAARGRDGLCRVTVQQAFRIVQPTREELMRQLELADEAALLERVREKLEEANVTQEEQRVETELLGRVIDAHEIELPEGLVEQQVHKRIEQLRSDLAGQGMPEAEIEAEAQRQTPELEKGAVRSAKALFLIERIAQAEGLAVGEAELRAELKSIAERNRASLDEVAAYYREQQLFGQLSMEILERKVRTFLRENALLKAPAA